MSIVPNDVMFTSDVSMSHKHTDLSETNYANIMKDLVTDDREAREHLFCQNGLEHGASVTSQMQVTVKMD